MLAALGGGSSRERGWKVQRRPKKRSNRYLRSSRHRYARHKGHCGIKGSSRALSFIIDNSHLFLWSDVTKKIRHSIAQSSK